MTANARIITAPPDTDPVTGLATALAYALDAFDLTITPRANDQDEPDMEDLTALAARILGKDDQ